MNTGNRQIDPVEYGKLDERVQHIGKHVEIMAVKIDNMHDMLMKTQGGWKVIIAVGGFFTAFGAMITKIVLWWHETIGK